MTTEAPERCESNRTLFIVQEFGKVPRIGRPMGDVAKSLLEWQAEYPAAKILVIVAPTHQASEDLMFYDPQEYISIDAAFRPKRKRHTPSSGDNENEY